MEEDWAPISEQPEWQDIQPDYEVHDTGVASIIYDPAHREAQAYFKVIQARKEYSDRAIDLTALLIDFNSANYTAWQYRWDCLLALGKDLQDEYIYTELISEENAKNYQLWNHRRKCAFALGKDFAAGELAFAARALNEDAKNYHAWAHRQAIVEEFNLWDLELNYTLQKIEEDVRNNSAWNQRMFVLRNYLVSLSSDVLKAELEFVADQILKASRNESAWQYLRGLFNLQENGAEQFSNNPQVFDLCIDVLRSNPSCSPALECLAEVYELLALRAAAVNQVEQASKARSSMVQLMSHLVVADPIRANYWVERANNLLVIVP